MSAGKSDLFVMGASNRPDLIDPALLRFHFFFFFITRQPRVFRSRVPGLRFHMSGFRFRISLGSDMFVMGAFNRPDLIDPALLRSYFFFFFTNLKHRLTPDPEPYTLIPRV